MLALVTRPRDDAESTAEALRRRGYEVLVEPMMAVIAQDAALGDLTGTQGFLVTSANGARALAQATARRDLPVWAVGDSSARTARDLGFAQVESADGDVDALARLVKAATDPRAGELLHAAGTELAGDLSGLLAQAGYRVKRAALYRTEAVTAFSERALRALASGAVGIALFYSPRTAKIFTGLAEAAKIHTGLKATLALALSGQVAKNLETLPWAEILVAPKPTQEHLLRTLDRDAFPSD